MWRANMKGVITSYVANVSSNASSNASSNVSSNCRYPLAEKSEWGKITDNKDINAILVRCGRMRPLLLPRVARALPNCFQTMRPLHWISMKFFISTTWLSHTCFFKRIQLINCCRSFSIVVSSGATWQCQGAHPRKVSFSSDMAAAVQEECRLRHNSTDYSSSRCQESSLVVCECKSARRCHPKLSW